MTGHSSGGGSSRILGLQKGSLLSAVTVLMSVRLNVEVGEESNERDTVDDDEAVQDEWEVTSGRHADDQVDNDHTELNQLQLRQITFPPQILLNFRTKGREEVVGVHDDMNKGVNHTLEEHLSSRGVLGS